MIKDKMSAEETKVALISAIVNACVQLAYYTYSNLSCCSYCMEETALLFNCLRLFNIYLPISVEILSSDYFILAMN